MASLKGLALGLGAVIVVGYIAVKTRAAEGIGGVAKAVTQTFASPLVGIGGGLKVLGEGVSTFLSPRIAPKIAPEFDWSKWLPFGNGNGRTEDRNGNGNGLTTYNGNGTREEDRNGNGVQLYRVMTGGSETRTVRPGGYEAGLPGYKPRPEDRNGLIAL